MTITASIPATSAARPQPDVAGASHTSVSFVVTEDDGSEEFDRTYRRVTEEGSGA